MLTKLGMLISFAQRICLDADLVYMANPVMLSGEKSRIASAAMM